MSMSIFLTLTGRISALTKLFSVQKWQKAISNLLYIDQHPHVPS